MFRTSLHASIITLLLLNPVTVTATSNGSEQPPIDTVALKRAPNAAAIDMIVRFALGTHRGGPRPAQMSARLDRIRSAAYPGVTSADRRCLATAIYFEARGETRRGQAAVAQVILNRARSAAYPDTVCGVVYQNADRRNACQFSFACDGKPDTIREQAAWSVAQLVAAEVVEGQRRSAILELATHYHADYVSPRWAPKLRRLEKIGRHIFYNEPRRS